MFAPFTLSLAHSQNSSVISEENGEQVHAQIIHDGRMFTLAVGILLLTVTAWRFYRDYKDAEADYADGTSLY